MLELNKEYTYKEICETLGWKIQTGNSKMAQIKEIEKAYEFYHPINKKTHKEKKSYIFTKKLRNTIEPSRANNGGGNNNKNVELMMMYLCMKDNIADGEYCSFTDLYCDKLKLFNKDTCNIVYKNKEELFSWCENNNIENPKLLHDYVSVAKHELKQLFMNTLKYMEKKELVDYNKACHFTYDLGKRSKGHVVVNGLNEKITEYETAVCNAMNKTYNLSSKMKGRQLLMIIYGSKELTLEFRDLINYMFMNDKDMMFLLNSKVWSLDSYVPEEDRTLITDENPLSFYNSVISISEIKSGLNPDKNAAEHFAKQIQKLISEKTQKQLLKKHYTFKATGEIIYPYVDCEKAMLKIEELLFSL